MKVGLSGVSVEGALKNLEQEIPAWDFDEGQPSRARRLGEGARAAYGSRPRTRSSKQIFYTALYHTMLAPTLFDDVDGQYRGMDLASPQAPGGEAQLQHVFALGYVPRAASALHADAAGARAGPDELPGPHGRRESRRQCRCGRCRAARPAA